jgi:pimeloyl-ACP methyl ester carboxylesterase
MIGAERWVVIGHSLGGIVALDLITHLPNEVTVAALVTVATPFGRPAISSHLKTARRSFPHRRVETWLNAFNPLDFVPGSGVCGFFSEATDIVVSGRLWDHSAETCLANEFVASEVYRGLFGSMGTEIARREQGVEQPWDRVQLLTALALQLSRHIEEYLRSRSLPGGTLERWHAAREVVAAKVASVVVEGRLASAPDLLTDLADELRGGADPVDLGSLLVYLASVNAVAPFEIIVSGEIRADAFRSTLSDLRVPPAFADTAINVLKSVRDCYRTPVERIPRVVWPVAAVVGVAVAVAAPIVVVAAAPAGLAGAAAITSGLAALGPGGMMGGLFVVGAMAGAGSLAAAAAAAAPRIAAGTPDDVRQSCIELMARAKINHKLSLVESPGALEWRLLIGIMAELTSQRAMLGAISDEKAKSLLEAHKKIGIVQKALDWMSSNGLGPKAIEAD